MDAILFLKGRDSEMKYEWKRNEKDVYGEHKKGCIVNVPKQNYLMIHGKGNPNGEEFSQKVSALYALAYGIKMNYKKQAMQGSEIEDYSVYPLEGVYEEKQDKELIKEHLVYTLMIKQPDVITKEMVDIAMKQVAKKKPELCIDEITFSAMQDNLCVDILHIGSFDDEPQSFDKMDAFASQNGLKRLAKCHREIYLNNANRVTKDKLKTILRYQVG